MKLIDYYKIIKKYHNLIININVPNLSKIKKFYNSYKMYKKLAPLEIVDVSDLKPRFNDNTPTTPFDAHYFYQGIWAFEKIKESGVNGHVDIGSEIRWVGLLSTITKVTFIDIRPFKTDLTNLLVKKGNILNMPYDNNSVNSLSCLHVAEHIGLGRYGDKLDAEGTKKACRELQRILAVKGKLYFSVPIGEQKTYFNAHRVHSLKTIIEYFKDLKLIELSGVTDSGRFIENIDFDLLEKSKYALGMFLFMKEKEIFT